MAKENFKDAGRLGTDYSSGIATESPKSKTVTRYSRVEVDAKNFPYLHSKKVGEKCVIKVEVEKAGESKPDHYETDKDNKIILEIKRIAEPKEKDEYQEMIEREE